MTQDTQKLLEKINENRKIISEQVAESDQNTLSHQEVEPEKNTSKTQREFQKHQRRIQQSLEIEFKQKEQYRKFLFVWVVIVSNILLLCWIGILVCQIVFLKQSLSDSVLISGGITIAAEFLGLVAIMFKYVFSPTKDVSDYVQENRKIIDD